MTRAGDTSMTTIFITGAGSGLNNGAALELAARGFEVIAGVEIYPQVRTLEIQAKERGVNLRIEKIDITKEGDRRRAASWDIDVLVNGAGIIEGGAIVDIPAENMLRQFEVSVFGAVLLTQGIAKKMIAKRSGKIIFMSSVVGILSGPFVGSTERPSTPLRASRRRWRWSCRSSACRWRSSI